MFSAMNVCNMPYWFYYKANPDRTSRSCIYQNAMLWYSTKNYYEALEVKADCSNKEIKEAYVKMCKKLHPDRNPGNDELHKKFIYLNEAYSVLSKPDLRQLYDDKLQHGTWTSNGMKPMNTNLHEPYIHKARSKQWHDETIWTMRNKGEDKFYEQRPYYGIKGINRLSNYAIAGGCVILILAGVFVHYMTFKFGVQISKRLDEKDKKIATSYAESRASALENGNEIQLERLRQRLESGKYSDKKQ